MLRAIALLRGGRDDECDQSERDGNTADHTELPCDSPAEAGHYVLL